MYEIGIPGDQHADAFRRVRDAVDASIGEQHDRLEVQTHLTAGGTIFCCFSRVGDDGREAALSCEVLTMDVQAMPPWRVVQMVQQWRDEFLAGEARLRKGE